jgi:predicted Zn-dependent protease with MMP-like domain
MTPAERKFFDRHLDAVMAELPEYVHRLLEDIPLYVEDRPSRQTLRELGIDDPTELCGLHTGIPLTDRSIEHSGIPSDVVQIFREGILALATGERGGVDENELRRQIRITILHELGHHHGLDEGDLDELGYG